MERTAMIRAAAFARQDIAMRFKTALLVLLLVLVAVFAIQNVAAVSVRFLAWELTIPRALMVFALLGIGIITGWLAATLRKRK